MCVYCGGSGWMTLRDYDKVGHLDYAYPCRCEAGAKRSEPRAPEEADRPRREQGSNPLPVLARPVTASTVSEAARAVLMSCGVVV